MSDPSSSPDQRPFKAFRIIAGADGRATQAGFVECRLDDLDPGDVVVKVEYSGINYKDALAATGEGRILRRPVCIGGIDLAGVVVSSRDPRFAPGHRVLATGFHLGVSHDGGYAEYARVPAEWLVQLPGTWTTWEAMAAGTAGFTAALAIIRMEHNGLSPARGPVVVTGATGGVGSLAVSLLARLGYRVVALTGRPQHEEYLRAIGASDVLPRQSAVPDPDKPLGKSTWAGAVDNVGGDTLAWILGTMKAQGVVASIGLAQSAALHTTVHPFILRGVSLLGINSSESPDEARAEAWRRLAGDLRPQALERIAETIAFDELPAAFRRLIDGGVRGRIVVRIGA